MTEYINAAEIIEILVKGGKSRRVATRMVQKAIANGELPVIFSVGPPDSLAGEQKSTKH